MESIVNKADYFQSQLKRLDSQISKQNSQNEIMWDVLAKYILKLQEFEKQET